MRRGILWIFPDEEPRFVELRGEQTLGRDPSCTIVVDVDQVSRRHITIRRNGPVFVVEDLGSRNGTYVNGERIEKAPLDLGNIVRIGEAVGMVWDAREGERPQFSELSPGFYGGPTMARRMRDLRDVARSDLAVVVQGMTGCGKEGVASAIHHYSGRCGRFVAINCAALQASLAESQLFGHKRGAFTGAERNEIGYVGSADGGTLFLDEVLELGRPLQAKLLRVLQQKEYVPLGDTRAVPVNLRVVAASQLPLADAVAAGDFREDLYARLNGYRFELPRLRDRREDVPFLFRHFLAQRFGGRPPVVRARLIEKLCLHEWPRNVRELETIVKRLSVIHGHRTELRVEQLAEVLDTATPAPLASPERAPSAPPGADREGRELVTALAEQGGNVVRAAKQLGISRARAYRMIVSLGLDVTRFRPDSRARGRRED